MKKYIFLGLIIALACFVAPVSADDTTSLPPQILGTVNMSEYPIYEPWNDENIGGWWNSTTNTFDPIAFLKSSVSPYTDFLGAYFYLILYSCFCLLVYFRSRGIELLTVSIGVTFGVWAIWMPPETIFAFLLCMGIGFTAILYRLFER